MKKLISITLALLLCFTLVACGTPQASESPSASTQPEGGASEGTGEATGETGEGSSTVEPMTISFSTTFQQAETGGQIIQYFVDKLAETSDGAIEVKMSWGGTLFDAPGELDAVADGAVDMVALGHLAHINTLPYLSFPGFAPGSPEAALEYFQTIVFDNEETSALIQGEASEFGVKFLNVIAGGANAFCADYEFTDLQTLVDGSSSFGNFDAAIFESLGFQVTAITPPDVYDALNRGLIDSTQMALAPMVALSWFEVAPYWALDGTYTAGNFFTVNEGWWNALSAEQQELIQAAATATQEYSATIYNESIETDLATLKEKTGNDVVVLSDADYDTFWAACFEAKAKTAIDLTTNAGKQEGMQKILEVAAEITDYDYQG